MKTMAIDYGDVRTGVCFSDLSGTIAGMGITVTAKGEKDLLQRLEALYREEKPSAVVLGLPRNMDGSEGPRAQKTRQFGDRLSKALGAEVIYWDERGSSVSANRILSDSGKKKARQRARVDAVAAAVILQNYLDFANRGR